MKRTTLITGVAGFLGSALAKKLLERGENVIGIDNFSRSNESRLFPLKKSGFTFVEGDVREAATIQKHLSQVNTVVHFAEHKIPRYGNSLETLEVNVEGTEILLDTIKNQGALFVLGSSSEVYGKCPEPLLHEESPLVLGPSRGLRWSYASSKLMAEHLTYAFGEKYKFPVEILRYSLVYGPGQTVGWEGGAPSVFLDAAVKGTPLPIHGDGLQSRTFTFINDAITGTLMSLDSEKAHGEILNISSSEMISIVNLAYLTWRVAGRREKPSLEFLSYTEFSSDYEEARQRTLDVSKAYYLLGFKAETALSEGLTKTFAAQVKPVEKQPSVQNAEFFPAKQAS